jgi:AmmeMemoRadiSam system protein A
MRGFDLSAESREALLRAARDSIASAFAKAAPERIEGGPELSAKAGAFVTLRIDGKLRGCIGRIVSESPLIETVRAMARAAAFDDPRFPPLEEHELPRVHIEISVLSPPSDCADPMGVVVGRDGLIARRGLRSGLLLPQVATEWGWGREEFLSHVCMKAGLEPDAWKDPGTLIQRFQAIVFSEAHAGT